jgi:hypothetical protein
MYTELIVASKQASFTELLDNREGIILDLENLHYYTLNAAAVFLWKQLRSAAETAATLSDKLADAFSVSRAQAERDTADFLAELRQYELISFSAQAEELQPVKTGGTAATELPPYEAPQLILSSSLAQVSLSGSATTSMGAISMGGGS